MTSPALLRLLASTRDAVRALPHDTDAVMLYRRAATRAEQVFPDALGLALAGTLAMAAHQREANGLPGILGEPNHHLALALAVLDLEAP